MKTIVYEFKNSNRRYWKITVTQNEFFFPDNELIPICIVWDEQINFDISIGDLGWDWVIEQSDNSGCSWKGSFRGNCDLAPSLNDVLWHFQEDVLSVCFGSPKHIPGLMNEGRK
jgi:hypothetical protein